MAGQFGRHVDPAAIGMIDPEAIDTALLVQLQQQAVGGVKNLGIFHPHCQQRVHIEETPEVEFLGGHLPVGQPVVLLSDAQFDRQILGAGPDRKDVVVIDEHRLGTLVLEAGDHAVFEGDLVIGEHGADTGPQERHQNAVAVVGAVEPARVGGVGAILQHRPDRLVVVDRSGHAHVVGDDIDDDAHLALVRSPGQSLEARASAHDIADPGVIDHVIAVCAAGRSLQNGAEVEIGDAQVIEVVQLRSGLIEAQIRPQLQPVGGHRDASPARWQVRTAPARGLAGDLYALSH